MNTTEKDRKSRKDRDETRPAEAAKIERIAAHTAGLVEDLKSWFELKIEYVLIEFKDDLKSMSRQYMREFGFQVGYVILLIVAALFCLTAAAFGLGAWLGHPAWGFLAITGLLVFLALVVKWVGRQMGRKSGKVKAYSYRVKDTQHKLPEKGKGSRGSTEPATGEDGLQQKTPELTANNHGKDQ